MNVAAPNRLTVDEFLRWCLRQERGRYELQDGRVIMQQSQNIAHVETKVRVLLALARAIERTGVPYYALGDGVSVRINQDTCCEPDALVAALPKPPPTALEVSNPVIVVEVLSPTSERRDLKEKVADYAQVPTIAHYLVVDPIEGVVLHHTRASMLAGTEPRRVTEPILHLDLPGIEVEVADVFAA